MIRAELLLGACGTHSILGIEGGSRQVEIRIGDRGDDRCGFHVVLDGPELASLIGILLGCERLLGKDGR